MLNRLKTLRKDELKMSQSKFANTLGYAQPFYSRLERGEKPINDKMIKLICAVHHVNEDWLRTGKGDIFISPIVGILEQMISTLGPASQKFLLNVVNGLAEQERELREEIKKEL